MKQVKNRIRSIIHQGLRRANMSSGDRLHARSVIAGISGRFGRAVARRLHHEAGWKIVGLEVASDAGSSPRTSNTTR